jgi:type 1 fimbriae regulatory protein FimB/type 1 fimbriae regulatory protein FimE
MNVYSWDNTAANMENSSAATHDVVPRQNSLNGTTGRPLPPRRQRNADVRSREYLTEPEVAALRKAALANVSGERDALMILMCFRHALRVSELVSLEWRDVLDLEREARAGLNVRRKKGSVSGTHPLEPDEVASLRKLRKANPAAIYIFTSNRGTRITEAAFRKMLSRLAGAAGMGELRIHPHMLRHATGHALANDTKVTTRELSELMGHANLNNTRRYTALNVARFRAIWRRHK